MELEKAKLAAEVELANAKATSIKEQDHSEQLYLDAMKAFSEYSGEEADEDGE
jgi:hypothetical protein